MSVKKPSAMDVQKQIDQLLYLLELYDAQAKVLNDQLRLIELQLTEFKSAKELLDSLPTMDLNKEVLFPIGGGVYIKGRVSDSETVLLDVGADVLSESSVKNAADIAAKSINELTDAKNKIETSLTETVKKSNEIRSIIERLAPR